MILHGNPRGGAKDLALHLLKEENDHVEIHQLRGFVSDNLVDALNEAYAVGRCTKARQFLFSLSLNPPANENASTEDFENAISRIEKEFGFQNQPRAIVFHEKQNRRHCHVVWSRTDTETLTVIPLPFYKRRLQTISKELYLEHGWDMPKGFIDRAKREPDNFTHAQWQQARRNGQRPEHIKSTLRDCWILGKTQISFEAALKSKGFTLAKGDRRGFVVLDQYCETRSVSKKWIGVKAADVSKKLAHPDKLPTVEQAKTQIAREMEFRLKTLSENSQRAIEKRQNALEQKRMALIKEHRQSRADFQTMLDARWAKETRERQARYNKGLRGFFDRITGKHRQIKLENEKQTLSAIQRDKRQQDEMIFAQRRQLTDLGKREKRLEHFKNHQKDALSQDIRQYSEIKQKNRKVFDFKEKMQSRQSQKGLDREP